jgi:hypothetical protein
VGKQLKKWEKVSIVGKGWKRYPLLEKVGKGWKGIESVKAQCCTDYFLIRSIPQNNSYFFKNVKDF